ncbi:hypothetical protein ACI3KY_03650 [Microbacterium sp. ZW T2_14]|uniref:hypothetical protein n=1 Tax=Microbacterium sp. ZW T2_14 TaxID=3378079 RepID=UPI003853E836
MTIEPRNALLDRTFFIVQVLKELDGILELIGGTPAGRDAEQVDPLARLITQRELSKNPH